MAFLFQRAVVRSSFLDYAPDVNGARVWRRTVKDFISVIQELYAAGITLGFQTNWDAHFDVWLEDNYSGRKVQATFTMDDLSAAERWLEEMAVVHFPSLYPRNAPARSRFNP